MEPSNFLSIAQSNQSKKNLDQLLLEISKRNDFSSHFSDNSDFIVEDITKEDIIDDNIKKQAFEQRLIRRNERQQHKFQKLLQIEKRVQYVESFLQENAEKKRREREAKIKRENELKTHYFFRFNPSTGQKDKTKVIYFGDTKNSGDASIPHGIGKFILDESIQEVVYEGGFHQGKMHGKGIFYFTNGDSWNGYFHMDCLHGVGIYTFTCQDSLIMKKNRTAIYYKNLRICFTDELYPGVSIMLHSVTGNSIGAMILNEKPKVGHYRVRLDDGCEKDLNLAERCFNIDHKKVIIYPLENIFCNKSNYRGINSSDFVSNETMSSIGNHDENFFSKSSDAISKYSDKGNKITPSVEPVQTETHNETIERLQKEQLNDDRQKLIQSEIQMWREKKRAVEEIKMNTWTYHQRNIAKQKQKLVEQRLNEQSKIDKNRQDTKYKYSSKSLGGLLGV